MAMIARSKIARLSRYLGSAVLLALVLSLIDFGRTYQFLKEIHPYWIVMTVLVLLVLRVLMAIRWHNILRAQGVGASLGEVVGVTFLASTLAPWVPGGLGVDIYRGYRLVSGHGRTADVVGTILLDRVIGVYSMVLVASFGALAAWRMGLGVEFLAMSLSLLVMGALGGALLFVYGEKLGSIRLPLELLNRWLRGLVRALRPMTDVVLLKKVLPSITILSLLVQLLRCFAFWLLYKAFAFDLDYVYFLSFVPLVFLISMLPISVGGLGVREGALVFFFGALGVPAEVSFQVGLLWYCLQIGISALTVVIWLLALGLGSLRRHAFRPTKDSPADPGRLDDVAAEDSFR